MARKILRYALLALVIALIVPILLFFRQDIPVETLKAAYTNPHSQFIEINGMAVHYRSEGQGFPVVLIHGTASSLHTWEVWTKTLKKDFQVIRMDLPAFGLTGPHPDRDYRIAAYVDFIHLFLEKLKVKRCHMGGNSLGGLISWEYALAHPERVDKMILIDAAGYPSERKDPWVFRLARTPILNLLVRYVTPVSFIENNLEQVYADDRKISQDLIDRYYKMTLRAGNRQAFIDRSSTQSEVHHEQIPHIQNPTLIQWGADDTWIPLSRGKRFHEDLPHSELIIYENAGHVPMEEIPEQTVQDALRFLKK